MRRSYSTYTLAVTVAVLLTLSCRQAAAPERSASDTAVVTAPARAKEPESDGSYERFMDKILSRKDIVYADSPVEAGQVWLWSDEEGSYQKELKTFYFGKTEFSITTMEVVNEDGDRLNGIRYDVDTAYIFSFKGRKYGWAEAHYYMCNGSGCLEQYYLLADFARKRLHVFRTMAVPQYNNYFGSLNGDDQLDVLIPDYAETANSSLPYSHTTEMLILTPYTLNHKGHFETLKNNKQDCFLIGQFDRGNFAPANFRILGSTCLFYDFSPPAPEN